MSNYTKATDFAAKDALASGNPSKVVQGTEIDAEFEAIETAVNSKADANTAALTSPVISGGTINNAVIGGTTPAAGTFTTLVGTAGTLNNVVIGGTTPAAGTFTTVTSVSWSGLPTVTAGAGLTGGGDLDTGDITLTIGAGTGITVNADDVALDTASTRNTDHSAVSITAGSGLTGGGTIASTRTINVGAGTGITVAADSVAFDTTFGDARYATLSGATFTGTVTIPTVDCNGGAIDGTTIGATTPAAGTFTTFTSTGIDDNASSTAITIDSSNRVGINTTPATGYSVRMYGASGVIAQYVQRNDTTASASTTCQFLSSSAVTAQILTSGAYQNLSDISAKTDIEPIDVGMDTILGLNPVSFYWKGEDGLAEGDKQIGFIAQEVQPMIPEAVSELPDGKLGMTQATVIPILVKAVQELYAEVQALKGN